MYPPVGVSTPLPAGAPATLLHRGQVVTLPGRFDHATATYLLSLLDYPAAQRLCEGQAFGPIPMTVAATRRAVGHVCAVDYHQTDVGPYREWLSSHCRSSPPPSSRAGVEWSVAVVDGVECLQIVRPGSGLVMPRSLR
jgi:hypothetical protein